MSKSTSEKIFEEKTDYCIGCYFESLQQKDHIDCPYGCLHVKENCEICKIISQTSKNTSEKFQK